MAQLALGHMKSVIYLRWHNEVDRTRLHELLRPFSSVKTLQLQHELISKLSHSLQSGDGEPPQGFCVTEGT